MENFILGVNYWASNAGADMWRHWDEKTIENDLELLCKNGVKVLRVFPNWRDFQPVKPLYNCNHRFQEYRMMDDAYPENPYYLSEIMLDRFATFCRIADKKGLKLIVGLITGWMSGRLYVPSAIYEKNIYTDPVAIYFQQLFIKGFVERMKDENAIYAWDLGNECNCMDVATKREEAYSWSLMIVNAIKACDPQRPIVSGMHGIELEGVWNIQDQGEITDILTTHPYPFWVEHCHFDSLTSFRTLMHATAQTQYYATIGGKPCLVEELGSMGPMVSSEEKAADFLKVNLWSNWANGATGVMWWCAHEQSHLTAAPYDWNMCERELGMVDRNMKEKPSLKALKAFSDEHEVLNIQLPHRQTDAVCIMSKGQDHWGISYMTYILAKQAGLTLDYAFCEKEIPDSKLYIMPSVTIPAMSKKSYDILKQKVYDGATLYISMKDGILTEFEEFTGFKVEKSRRAGKTGTYEWNGSQVSYRKTYQIGLSATRAEVLLEDEEGNPLFGVCNYGAGKVYLLNFAVEDMLLTQDNGFDAPYYEFYRTAAKEVLELNKVQKENPFVGMTIHKGSDADYAVLVNYTEDVQKPGVTIDKSYYKNVEVVRGNMENMEAFDAVVLKLEK